MALSIFQLYVESACLLFGAGVLIVPNGLYCFSFLFGSASALNGQPGFCFMLRFCLLVSGSSNYPSLAGKGKILPYAFWAW